MAHDPAPGNVSDPLSDSRARFREWIDTFTPHDPPGPLDLQLDAPRGPVSITPPFRPAPTATCAGITPGFEHLVTEAKRKRRRKARLVIVRVVYVTESGGCHRG